MHNRDDLAGFGRPEYPRASPLDIAAYVLAVGALGAMVFLVGGPVILHLSRLFGA